MQNKFKERFFDDKKKYSIIIAFFDWMLRTDFKHILQCFAEDISFGSDSGGCNLPSFLNDKDGEEDENDGEYLDGIMFYECDVETIIDYSMYIKCIELACEIYMEEHGEDEEVKRDLQIIKDRYADK